MTGTVCIYLYIGMYLSICLFVFEAESHVAQASMGVTI